MVLKPLTADSLGFLIRTFRGRLSVFTVYFIVAANPKKDPKGNALKPPGFSEDPETLPRDEDQTRSLLHSNGTGP